jgi:hypothetical protein
MTNRRPIDPPPIMMALPNMGDNRRCMVCLSFQRAIYLLLVTRDFTRLTLAMPMG